MSANQTEREGSVASQPHPEEPPAKKTRVGTEEAGDQKGDLPSEGCDEATHSQPAVVAGAKADCSVLVSVKVPKRKVAVFIAYLGVGYQGMQRSPGVRSIEEELGKAMVKAGGISECNADDFKKVDWARAGRTDKGVSAVGQVVSLKMMIDPPGLVERINSHLPEQIRIMGYVRTTSGFSAYRFCDRRRYEYVLPTFAFDKRIGLPMPYRSDADVLRAAKTSEEEAVKNAPFVFDYAVRSRLNSVLRTYVGTKNHHNFTKRVAANDSSAKRYIISFECSEPFEVDGKQFVRLVVVGQSFMLHQIRKMVGTALGVMRDVAPETVYEHAFSEKHQINVPMAPELGLFLDEAIFHAYNQRFAQTHAMLSCANYQEQIDDFKRKFIYPHIAQTEEAEDTCRNWLRELNVQNYPFKVEPVA
uniref:Pseudouridine synthase I TruA alpha/beta domain-containing protein n=1 Tax=Pyramimonas obovata TaxID=1411642 RepID=A0A7S0WG01_9CHLO|mmetsp:Transcript_2481/g.5125  ORF Transcript_2481/g.5125 Transcript_2481/m.5125 type:complete len:416 (+) Transcript_2481:110-1357(+)|eukprot:CAMPEP_0118943302 /NCGR_PEP_ID=MMETSP1169-20130426/38044_1 /TAXON_ID=36882 /ORGANISM="Pyramimonas obovata, Strain CCMP722" /LENGTH=415 /DNA_ID=CAMNT_0006888527 /DNA_START=96 /DNA_END=1343 /DNA_ORIENTATION=-